MKRQQVASAQAAEEAAQRLPKPLPVECDAPSVLKSVQATLAKQPGMEIFKIYNAEPNPLVASYLALPAMERVRHSKEAMALPQCFATAMTSTGEVGISFRVFVAANETFIEVNQREAE